MGLSREELQELQRYDLQILAKKYSVRANSKSAEIVDNLVSLSDSGTEIVLDASDISTFKTPAKTPAKTPKSMATRADVKSTVKKLYNANIATETLAIDENDPTPTTTIAPSQLPFTAQLPKMEMEQQPTIQPQSIPVTPKTEKKPTNPNPTPVLYPALPQSPAPVDPMVEHYIASAKKQRASMGLALPPSTPSFAGMPTPSKANLANIFANTSAVRKSIATPAAFVPPSPAPAFSAPAPPTPISAPAPAPVAPSVFSAPAVVQQTTSVALFPDLNVSADGSENSAPAPTTPIKSEMNAPSTSSTPASSGKKKKLKKEKRNSVSDNDNQIKMETDVPMVQKSENVVPTTPIKSATATIAPPPATPIDQPSASASANKTPLIKSVLKSKSGAVGDSSAATAAPKTPISAAVPPPTSGEKKKSRKRKSVIWGAEVEDKPTPATTMAPPTPIPSKHNHKMEIQEEEGENQKPETQISSFDLKPEVEISGSGSGLKPETSTAATNIFANSPVVQGVNIFSPQPAAAQSTSVSTPSAIFGRKSFGSFGGAISHSPLMSFDELQELGKQGNSQSDIAMDSDSVQPAVLFSSSQDTAADVQTPKSGKKKRKSRSSTAALRQMIEESDKAMLEMQSEMNTTTPAVVPTEQQALTATVPIEPEMKNEKEHNTLKNENSENLEIQISNASVTSAKKNKKKRASQRLSTAEFLQELEKTDRVFDALRDKPTNSEVPPPVATSVTPIKATPTQKPKSSAKKSANALADRPAFSLNWEGAPQVSDESTQQQAAATPSRAPPILELSAAEFNAMPVTPTPSGKQKRKSTNNGDVMVFNSEFQPLNETEAQRLEQARAERTPLKSAKTPAKTAASAKKASGLTTPAKTPGNSTTIRTPTTAVAARALARSVMKRKSEQQNARLSSTKTLADDVELEASVVQAAGEEARRVTEAIKNDPLLEKKVEEKMKSVREPINKLLRAKEAGVATPKPVKAKAGKKPTALPMKARPAPNFDKMHEKMFAEQKSIADCVTPTKHVEKAKEVKPLVFSSQVVAKAPTAPSHIPTAPAPAIPRIRDASPMRTPIVHSQRPATPSTAHFLMGKPPVAPTASFGASRIPRPAAASTAIPKPVSSATPSKIDEGHKKPPRPNVKDISGSFNSKQVSKDAKEKATAAKKQDIVTAKRFGR